jgi:Domain of unknown function (DUF5063)
MEKEEIKLVEDFRNVAEQYCALVDASDRTDRSTFLSRVYLVLPELIKSAANLPAVSYENDPEYVDFVIPPRVSVGMRDADWWQLYDALKKKLEPTDIYWVAFQCWKDGDTYKESLADDIADIYRDLKNGMTYQITKDVAFQSRLLFYSHWGDHAVRALKAIHGLMAEKEME